MRLQGGEAPGEDSGVGPRLLVFLEREQPQGRGVQLEQTTVEHTNGKHDHTQTLERASECTHLNMAVPRASECGSTRATLCARLSHTSVVLMVEARCNSLEPGLPCAADWCSCSPDAVSVVLGALEK